MSATDTDATVEALMARAGRTYAEDAGITLKDTPEIRGMIRASSHMLKVEEVAGE